MTVMRHSILSAIAVAAALTSGCSKEDRTAGQRPPLQESLRIPDGLTREQAALPVAKVGNRVITVGEVTEEINRLSPYIRRRWAAPEKRREFLQKLIQIEMLSMEAERLGLGNAPEVQRAVEQVMIRLLVKNDLEKTLLPSTVDDSLLEAEYEKDWNKYHEPTQYRMSEIVVKDEKTARRLLAEILAHESPKGRFRELAQTASIDRRTGERGGDIGYVLNPADIEKSVQEGKHPLRQNPDVDPAVAKASWTLAQRDDILKEPVRTPKGYHLLMLTTIKPAIDRSFNSMKRMIESQVLRRLRREKMDEYVAALRKNADIRIFEDNLAKLELEEPAPPQEEGNP